MFELKTGFWFRWIQRNCIQNVNIRLHQKYCLQLNVNILFTVVLDTVELAFDCIQSQFLTQTQAQTQTEVKKSHDTMTNVEEELVSMTNGASSVKIRKRSTSVFPFEVYRSSKRIDTRAPSLIWAKCFLNPYMRFVGKLEYTENGTSMFNL